MAHTNLCLTKERYEEISGANASRARNQMLMAVGLTLLGILVFVIVMVILYINYKTKLEKIERDLKSAYTNITAPDMKVSAVTAFCLFT